MTRTSSQRGTCRGGAATTGTRARSRWRSAARRRARRRPPRVQAPPQAGGGRTGGGLRRRGCAGGRGARGSGARAAAPDSKTHREGADPERPPSRKRGTHTDRYGTGTSLAGKGKDEDGSTTSRSARAGGNKRDTGSGGGVLVLAQQPHWRRAARHLLRDPRVRQTPRPHASVVREAGRQPTGPHTGARTAPWPRSARGAGRAPAAAVRRVRWRAR